MSGHRGIPVNPEATDSLARQRRRARCETCGGWLLRVSILRPGRPLGAPALERWQRTERRIEWHHRERRHAL